MYQSMDCAHFKLWVVGLIAVLIVPIIICNPTDPREVNNNIGLMEPNYNISALGAQNKVNMGDRFASTARNPNMHQSLKIRIQVNDNQVKNEISNSKTALPQDEVTGGENFNSSSEYSEQSNGINLGPRNSTTRVNNTVNERSANEESIINFDTFFEEISNAIIILEPKIEKNSKIISLVGKVMLKSDNNQTFPLDSIEFDQISIEDLFRNLKEKLRNQGNGNENQTNWVPTNNQLENKIGTQINDQPSEFSQKNCTCSCPKSDFDENSTPKSIPTQVITPTPASEKIFTTTSVVSNVTESPSPTTTSAPTTMTQPILKTTNSPPKLTNNTTLVALSGTLAPEVHRPNEIVEKFSTDSHPRKPKPVPQTPWNPDGAKPQYRGSNNPYLENEIETRDNQNNQINSQIIKLIHAPEARGINELSQPDYSNQFIHRRDQNVPSNVQKNHLSQPYNSRQKNPDYNRYNVQIEAVNRNVPNRHEQYLPFAVEEIAHHRLTPQVKRDFITRVISQYIGNVMKPQELFKETYIRQPPQSKPSQFQRKLL